MSWAVIQPLTATLIFTLVFGRLAGLPADGIPYRVFSPAALVAWNLVATGVSRASTSLVSSATLLTRVYFPRLLVPLAATLGGLPDFAVGFLVLAGMLVFYGIAPTPAMLALPLFVALALVTALAFGIWLAALNAQYRDVGHVTPFLIQMWLYSSPVAYSSDLVPERWRPLYALNPAVGVVEGFRWVLLGTDLDVAVLGTSTMTALVVLVAGTLYFRWKERTVADVI
jgi:lipopolysaccharide transport system permease protein